MAQTRLKVKEMADLPKKIKTLDDVSLFAEHIKGELGLGFHPDDPFEDYINTETRADTYTPAEAKLRNELLEQAFEVCDKEKVSIYGFMGQIIVKGTPMEGMFD